jgi:hypothetical protein
MEMNAEVKKGGPAESSSPEEGVSIESGSIEANIPESCFIEGDSLTERGSFEIGILAEFCSIKVGYIAKNWLPRSRHSR